MSALNILLVDDNPNLAIALSRGLREALGKAISVAVCLPWHRTPLCGVPGQVSGPEALSMLATQRFDVVVSDFDVLSVSGLELMNKIRQDCHETVLLTAAYRSVISPSPSDLRSWCNSSMT